MLEKTKELICQTINRKPGIRAIDLLLKVISDNEEFVELGSHFNTAIEELVENGDIVEIEYVLDTMNYRCKTIYFPKGTHVRIPQ